MMELPVPRRKIVDRLKRIEGQARGLQKMVTDERECIEILTQLASTNSAMQSIAGLVLQNYAVICATKGETPEEIGRSLSHAVAVWLRSRGS